MNYKKNQLFINATQSIYLQIADLENYREVLEGALAGERSGREDGWIPLEDALERLGVKL